MKKFAFVLLSLLLLSCLLPASAQELRVDFYNMGKADAMLITTPEGTRILIDTGTNKGGKQLAERFEKDGIDFIDTLIITHYDKDHVGGADQVLESVSVRQVIMPIYEKESKQLTQFMEALDALPDIIRYPMEIGSDMAMQSDDGVHIALTAAHKPSYGKDEENDFSLAVRLTYGDTKFFFAGDAEAPRQAELIEEGNVACDVLKVPYHGRLVSTSKKFLAAANPKIAYITDDEEDPAHPIVLKMLKELGADVYCAKDDGDIVVVSDGTNVSVK